MSDNRIFYNTVVNIPAFRRAGATTLFLFAFGISGFSNVIHANDSTENKQAVSKRIEVYSLSQSYWDVRYGDTLGTIIHHLLPNNPALHGSLQQDILQLNLDAFINGNPEKLLAGKRLRLPGYIKQADTRANPATTVVETYSWGNIKRPKK